METKTKVFIGIGSAITLGLVAYFTRNVWMPKKTDYSNNGSEQQNVYTSTAPATSASSKVDTPPAPVAIPTAPAKGEADRTTVSATTLLDGNLQSGKNKGLYADMDGLLLLDMNNKIASKTKKGQRVGTIYSAEKSGNNIVIYFIGPGGVKLKTVSQGMSVK